MGVRFPAFGLLGQEEAAFQSAAFAALRKSAASSAQAEQIPSALPADLSDCRRATVAMHTTEVSAKVDEAIATIGSRWFAKRRPALQIAPGVARHSAHKSACRRR